MTVSDIDRRMPSSELTEWMAFYELEPFGPRRDNIHTGQIASLLYNANRRKNTPALTVSDFMLKDEYAKREEDTAQFLTGLRALAKEKGSG